MKFWLFLLACFIWALGSIYWYTCEMRSVCTSTGTPYIFKEDLDETGLAPMLTPQANQTDLPTMIGEIALPVTVYFGADTDEVLTEDVESKLKPIAEYLKNNTDKKMLVTGHTNSSDNNDATVTLGMVRANTVKDMLVSLGAPAESIMTESKGQSELVDTSGTDEGQAKNRRAVLTLVK